MVSKIICSLIMLFSSTMLTTHQKDFEKISQIPSLEHISQSLLFDQDQTPLELIERAQQSLWGEFLTFFAPSIEWLHPSGGLMFSKAPDPSELLKSMNADNSNRPADQDSTRLKVLTYNVGLLNFEFLSVVGIDDTPFLKERRPTLANHIFEKDYDVILLQELWAKDYESFIYIADYFGYTAFIGDREGHDDGLMICIKKEFLDEATEIEVRNVQYKTQFVPFAIIGNVKNAYLEVSMNHSSLGTIRIYNTHLIPMPEGWRKRMAQARELGLAILADNGPNDIAILGGDLNGGPFYEKATWQLPNKTVTHNWYRNALMYPIILHYGDLVDLSVRGRDSDQADNDVFLAKNLRSGNSSDPSVFGLRAGFCDDLEMQPFTASDCNRLFFLQYGGKEYPARLDHLLAKDPQNRIHVSESRTVFTEQTSKISTPKPVGPPDNRVQKSCNPKDELYEMSDHYGAEVILHIRNMR